MCMYSALDCLTTELHCMLCPPISSLPLSRPLQTAGKCSFTRISSSRIQRIPRVHCPAGTPAQHYCTGLGSPKKSRRKRYITSLLHHPIPIPFLLHPHPEVLNQSKANNLYSIQNEVLSLRPRPLPNCLLLSLRHNRRHL